MCIELNWHYDDEKRKRAVMEWPSSNPNHCGARRLWGWFDSTFESGLGRTRDHVCGVATCAYLVKISSRTCVRRLVMTAMQQKLIKCGAHRGGSLAIREEEQYPVGIWLVH